MMAMCLSSCGRSSSAAEARALQCPEQMDRGNSVCLFLRVADIKGGKKELSNKGFTIGGGVGCSFDRFIRCIFFDQFFFVI